MLHTLEMVVNMQTSGAINGLNAIEDKILNLVNQINSFNPVQIFTEDQATKMAKIQEGLRMTERLTGTVNDRNLETVYANQQYLKDQAKVAQTLLDQGNYSQEAAKAVERNNVLAGRLNKYYTDANKLINKRQDLVSQLVKDGGKIGQITKTQHKDLKQIVSTLKAMKKAGMDIKKQTGLTNEEVENIVENYDELNVKIKDYNKDLKMAAKTASNLIPGAGELAKYGGAIGFISNGLKDMHTQFEANSAAINLNLKGINKADDLYNKLADITAEVAGGNVLMAEAQKSVTAVLSKGGAILADNNSEIVDWSKNVAQATRVTGVSEAAFVDMSASIKGLTKNATLAQSTITAMSGSMKALGVTTANSQTTVANMSLNVAKFGSFLKDDSTIKAFQMNLLGAASAASKLGLDAASTQTLLGGLIDPFERLNKAVLLSKGGLQDITNATPEQAMAAAAKAAGQLRDQLDSGAISAKDYSIQLSVMEIDDTQARILQDMNNEITNGALEGKDLVKRFDELAAGGKKIQDNSPEDATRKFQEAMTNLAVAVTPVIKLLNEVGSWIADSIKKFPIVTGMIVALSGGIAGLVLVVRPIKSLFGGISKVFGGMADGVKKIGSSKGGGLGGLGKSIGGFFKSLAKIDVKGALKGALAIAAVGVALGVGVAAIGYAATLLPPNKALELAVVIGGLVAATYLLIPISKVGPKALLGALALAATGVALAIGVAALGKAIQGMSMGKIKMLGILAAGLVVTTGLLALIGIPAVAGLALVGAGTVLAVSILLSAAIAILGSVSGNFTTIAGGIEIMAGALGGLTPQMGEALASVGVGLAAFAAALVGGAIAEFFGADMVGQARLMAEALVIMQPAIASLAAMGPGAAGAFKDIGQGLEMVSNALSGGGALDFFSGDTIENAKDLAAAMGLVAKPIGIIGAIGIETARVFNLMAVALRTFMEVVTQDAGMFDSFENNATDIANAMDKIAASQFMKDQRLGNRAEELSSTVSLQLERESNEKQDMLIERLDRLIEIAEQGSEESSNAELQKITKILQNMATDSILNSNPIGSSSADSQFI